MRVHDLFKRYGDLTVTDHLTEEFPSDGVTVLMGASGSGKTTLLRLLMGLEKPDGGTFEDLPLRFSAVFQQDVLCEGLSGLKNVKIVCPGLSDSAILDAFGKIGLSEEEARRPVSAYSGGMKRRCAIVRAMTAEGTFVFLDEPFKGLDDGTRKAVIAYMKETRRGRGILLVTHDERDAEAFGARIVRL